MRVDWDSILGNLTIIFGIAVVGAIIITIGWFIGSANAHATRIQHEYELTCIHIGGNIKYEPEVGDVCTTIND